MQRLAARFEELERREPAAFERLAQVMNRGDQVAHCLGEVWLEVGAPDDALIGVEIDQDQRPIGKRRDPRDDRPL